MMKMNMEIEKIIELLEILSATNNEVLKTHNDTLVLCEENFKKMNIKQVFEAIVDMHDIICNHVFNYDDNDDEELEHLFSVQFDAIYQLGRKLNIK